MLDLKTALARIACIISATNRAIGQTVAWGIALMILIIFVVIVLRHGFDLGWVALQESALYLHGIVFLLGAAYTLSEDGHVRVDVIYQRLGSRGKAWINLLGTLLFLLPSVGVIIWYSLPYVIESWRVFESSPETGGLPGIFIVKSLLPLSAALLALQGIAIMLTSLNVILHPLERGE